MEEVIQVSFSPVNFIPTLLVLIVFIYWITVIIGALDMGFLDFDLDADYDSDAFVDMNPGGDADIAVEQSPSVTVKILSFLNLGKIPFMVFMSFFAMCLWTFSVLGNHYLHISSVWPSIIMLMPYTVASLFITKFLTIPFVGIFERLERDELTDVKLVGKIGRAKWDIRHDKISQLEIDHNGTDFLVNARTEPDKEIKTGEMAFVIQYIEKERLYLVEPYFE